MAISAVYQSGVAKKEELADANLQVDVAILGTTEYWDKKDNRDPSWFINAVTPEFVRNYSQQAIAFTSFGEIDPRFWSSAGPIKERMSWDKDRDGIPDEDAPSWLGPVNLNWKIPYQSEWENYSSWGYQNQYPLYMVRFWQDEFIEYIKEEIDFYQKSGWDGIFFDTVPPGQWTESNELHSPLYSWDELAENAFSGLKKIRDFIDESHPDFKLYINGSSLVPSWMHIRPDTFNLLDGIVLESKLFYGTKDGGNSTTHGNKFPAHFELDDWQKDNNHLLDMSSLMDQQGVDIPVILTEYVDDLPEIAAKTAISLDELGSNFTAHLVYDSLFRSKTNPEERTLSQNYIAYVGGDEGDRIFNTTNSKSIIVGGYGDDVLLGSKLDDVLMGGEGDDIIKGGKGFDIAVYDHPLEAYVINSSKTKTTVELKSEFRYVLELDVYSWSVPGHLPEFDLYVNDSLMQSGIVAQPGKTDSFQYRLSAPIESIKYKNTNGAYFPEYESAIGTSIKQITVNGRQVDLSKVAFLDGKEEWAGYEAGAVNAGYGDIYFSNLDFTKNAAGGLDELHSIERLIFSDDLTGLVHKIKIETRRKFRKKTADVIIDFKSSVDAIEIDVDSFGIDSSATFAAGKNMKAVKKKLAKKDFDFLYDEKKGGLYFNENGSDKGFGDGGIIAILKGASELNASNLEFI